MRTMREHKRLAGSSYQRLQVASSSRSQNTVSDLSQHRDTQTRPADNDLMESRMRPKPCAMSRTKRIAAAGGRSSGQGLRGDPTNLDLKRRGEKSMLGKRGAVEDV